MTSAQAGVVLQYLRRIAGRRHAAELSDAQLVARFTTQRDELAFAALVRRHGPMVLNVCRSVLHHEQDAEDSFQATFLVLARKAGSLRRPEALAGWLCEVAYHVALRAHADASRRRAQERRATPMLHADSSQELKLRDLRRVLHEELLRLPEKYRLPLVLCYLEGRSQEEAAGQLGWSKGSFRGRLNRGREHLRRRLLTRGVALSGVLCATAVAPGPAATALVAATVRAVTRTMANVAASGAVSAKVMALAEGVSKTLVLSKVKTLTLFLVVASIVVGSAGALARHVFTEQTAGIEGQAGSPKPDASTTQFQKETPQLNMDRFGDPLPAGALARLGTVRFRDITHPTIQLAYAAGGKVLISSGAQYFSLCAWDAESGRPLYQRGAPRLVMSLAVSPDGKSLFFSDMVGFVWGIDVATGKNVRKFALPGRGISGQAAFSPDDDTVAVASFDDWRLLRWEFATGRLLPLLGGREEIGGAVAYAPDGTVLATAHIDQTIRLFDAVTGKEVRRLSGHDRAIQSIAFAPEGKVLASAGEGSVIRLWDLATGKVVRQLTGSAGFNCTVVFSPDSRFLACLGGDGTLDRGRINTYTLQLFDAHTGKQLHRWEAISAMAFAPDGKEMATVRREGVIRRWEPETGKEINPPTGHVGPVNRLHFTLDGRTLFSLDQWGTVVEWDVHTSRQRRPLFTKPAENPAAAQWTAAAFSPDGKVIALVNRSESAREAVRLIDAPTGTVLRALSFEEGSGRRAGECRFSPDGRLLATLDRRGIRLWSVASGMAIHDMPGGPFAFSPDGAQLAVAGETMRLWDTATGKETRQWQSGQQHAWRLIFLPDGKKVASADGESVRVWAVATGKELHHLTGGVGRPVGGPLAASPSSRVLAVGGVRQWRDGDGLHESGTITLWDLFSGERIRQFDVPQGVVTSVAFTPDGRTLASGGWDSTILMWDATSPPQKKGLTQMALTERELDDLWSALAGNAGTAEEALWSFVRVPRQATAYLQGRLRFPRRASGEQAAKLIADLGNKQFRVRQQAIKGLDELGEAAEGEAYRALEGSPTLEARRRLESFLEKQKLEVFRKLRAVEILEQVGTPDARKLLQMLVQEASNPRVLEAASAALQRLRTRGS